jgi:hypothetical protein
MTISSAAAVPRRRTLSSTSGPPTPSTTPHLRVEHHTAIPLLHFWDATFAPGCRWFGKDEWAQEKT